MRSDWAYASPKKREEKKKGAANLEFVLSFVIFVVFLVFLYSGLDPIIKTAGSKQFVLGHLKLALLENLTLSDFTIRTFSINLAVVDLTKPCINVHEGGLWKLIGIEDGRENNLTIKNELGETLNYTLQPEGNPTSFLIGPTSKIQRGILKVYLSSEFTNRSPQLMREEDPTKIENRAGQCYSLTCKDSDPDNCEYSIETIVEKEIISSSNVDAIQDAYYDNYGNLKDILGVPFGNDFVIGFQTIGLRLEDGDILWPENALEPPSDVSVYVGEFPIQYIDEEANIKIGFLVVKVW